METEAASPRRPAPRKSAGRAPLQDLSLQQPVGPQKPKPLIGATESAKSSSLTPLFNRLQLKDGRGILPGSKSSMVIKIWAESQPSPKETLEENEAHSATEGQQLGLVPNISSVPKATERAGSPHHMGEGEGASSAISPPGGEPGEELVLGVLMTPQDNFGRWQLDTAVTSYSDREGEKDGADWPCTPETPHASEAVRHTATTTAENCTGSGNKPCQDTAAMVASAVRSACSPVCSADGRDPEEAPVTQVLGSPPPPEENGAWAVTPPSSLSALKKMEENSSALPGPGGTGNCPLTSDGNQPSLLLPEDRSFPAAVLKDVVFSSLQKPSLAGGSAMPSPASSTETGDSVARTVSWMIPLVWLEKNTHATSAMLDSLRQSLPLPALQRDAGTSISPVSTFSAATWMSPRALLEKSMNTSGEWPACATDSAVETDSLLWHCSREQLSTLSRQELEGRLESTLIIVEALSRQLRDWQQGQWPVPRLGPADQRDVLTQTDITHPKAEEQLYHDLYVESRQRLQVLQWHQGSERALKQELEQARQEMRSWIVESRSLLDSAKASLQNVQEDRRTVSQEQDQLRALISRHRSCLDKVVGKLQSCLAEREEMRRQAAEAMQAKEGASSKLERVSRRLEEVTVSLQDSAAQVDQLTVANSRLGADLSTLLRDLASLEHERDQLQEKLAELSEESAQLTRAKELLQQEHAGVRQELREMAESREFLDQEYRLSHEQLVETEKELKVTLAVLRERTMQHEDLKDAYQNLQTERDKLCEELRCSKAEALDLQLNRNKILTCSLELTQSKERVLELSAALRAAMQGKASDAACRSGACTPRSRPISFVGSVLKAVAEGVDEEGAGVEPAAAREPADIEENLLETALELREAVSHLVTVSSQAQEAASCEIQGLQAKISDHQHQLESLEDRLQAEIDAGDANVAKLNKVLRVRFQTEKELQDVVRQQEEKMLRLIDQSGEVTSLKMEVSHLKHLLQRAETEAEALWEEVRGRQPGTMPLDAGAVQEKVWLRQEVNKLRELLLEKAHEYQDHRRVLEGKLCDARKMLQSHKEMQERIKETLSSIPAAVTASSQELQSLLGYLEDGNRHSGDAL
uniref:Sperm-associated antigen 5 n=1 Tax=Pelusios castaneus TaxID=367368 RepID=A0A8C8S6H3_9SAUR